MKCKFCGKNADYKYSYYNGIIVISGAICKKCNKKELGPNLKQLKLTGGTLIKLD